MTDHNLARNNLANATERAPLGIAGIPSPLSGLRQGRIHLVVTQDQRLATALAAQCLETHLLAKRYPAYASPGDPKLRLRDAALAGIDITAAVRNERVGLITLDAGHDGEPTGILRTLIANPLPNGTTLVLEDAHRLFDWSRPDLLTDTVRQLREWASGGEYAVLLLTTAQRLTRRRYEILKTSQNAFDGFAKLLSVNEVPTLSVRHWPSDRGGFNQAPVLLSLRWDETRLIANDVEVHPHDVPNPNDALDADFAQPQKPIHPNNAADFDEVEHTPRFIAVASAADGLDLSHDWQLVDTVTEAVNALPNGATGILLLPYEPGMTLKGMTDAINLIRKKAPGVRIAVRERKRSLRLTGESALLRLGASVVLHSDLPTRSMLSVLNAIQDLPPKPMVINALDAALTPLEGPRSDTTLPPALFRQRVQDYLNRESTDGIPCVLVELHPSDAQKDHDPAAEMRHACRDALIGAEPTVWWVFLYGCRLSDAHPVIQRAFGDETLRRLKSVHLHAGPPRIRQALSLQE